MQGEAPMDESEVDLSQASLADIEMAVGPVTHRGIVTKEAKINLQFMLDAADNVVCLVSELGAGIGMATDDILRMDECIRKGEFGPTIPDRQFVIEVLPGFDLKHLLWEKLGSSLEQVELVTEQKGGL